LGHFYWQDIDDLKSILRGLGGSVDHLDDENISRAILEFTIRRQSRGGSGKSFSRSKRLRGGVPENINCWYGAIDNLKKIRTKHLNKVMVTRTNAIGMLMGLNSDNNLIYLDPPYIWDSRHTAATNMYKYEMSNADHVELLDVIKDHKAKILISGYDSALYRDTLSNNWNVHTKSIVNHSSQNKTKQMKTEYLWTNF
jgi:DNA adenine methylase